ncbi:MAG: hypothetical protein Kow0037_11730 [Calditrichia bacterium]
MVEMKILKIVVTNLLLISLLFGGALITEWKAEPGQDKIILSWKTSSEVDVAKFVVERSINNKSFSDIGEVAARGPGYSYQFVDENLGKLKSLYYYRLRIVNIDGSYQHNEPLPVIPNISSINQTWGSIKALFR